jgi:hypothetical protein
MTEADIEIILERAGHLIRYRMADLMAWMEACAAGGEHPNEGGQ